MKRIQDLEGYLLIDHRNSPGISAELLAKMKMPPESGRGIFEGPAYTCGHCQAMVLMNSLRTRERHVCRGCMHVICDVCADEKARTLQCRPFNQRADEILIAAESALSKE